MHADILFFLNSIMLGIGLAMDAFSVSITNGLSEPDMGRGRRSLIAGVYAAFQFLMPMLGWICVHTVIEYFTTLQKFTPVIALVLLLFIGIKMIVEAIRDRKGSDDAAAAETADGNAADAADKCPEKRILTMNLLLIQGIATSIDALSVGVTFAEYSAIMALTAALIIGIVTYAICMIGLHIGRKVGSHFSDKAQIIGGCILIFIGLEIFIRGIM